LVGLNLSASDVPNVKQRLGIGTPPDNMTARLLEFEADR
jgi:hypothetical protein